MKTLIKNLLKITASAAVIVLSASTYAANTVIDVMVVYTKGTADAYGGDPSTRINQLIQFSNQIYKDSNLPLELRLVKTLMVNYTDDNAAETALNDITFAQNAAFSSVAAARDQSKADMVIFYRPFKSVQGSCGLAWIGGQGTNGDFSNPYVKNYMYAHIAINSCGDFVTAHELGHNMGLKHSRKQDGSGGTFPYALGYGVMNQFTTIMAYQSEFNVDYWTGKQYKFSSPDLTCRGVPCGVSRSDTVNGSDARYALTITTPQIANFYAAPVASSSVSSKSSSSLSSIASSKASSAASSSVAVTKPVSSSSSLAASSKSSVPATGVTSSSPAASSKSSVASSSVKAVSSASSSSKAAVAIFNRVADVAQYGGADWANEVSRSKALTIDQAKAIAAANPKITYFFITKGVQMSLGAKGVFRTGDVVFFSGKPWYGSAPGLADAYEKAP